MSTTALSHRKPAYASGCTGSCGVQGHVKRDTVLWHELWFCKVNGVISC